MTNLNLFQFHLNEKRDKVSMHTLSVSGCKWPIIGNDSALRTFVGGFDGPAPSNRFSLTNIGVEKH